MTVMAKAASAAALLAALTLGTSSYAQTRPASAPIPESTTTLMRATLVVENMDRAIDFYARLGFVKASDRTTTAADTDGVIGARDLPLAADPTVGRMVVMKGAGDKTASIVLLGYDKPGLTSARGNLAALGTGDVLFVMEVADIAEVYKRLSQIGTHFHRTPTRYAGNEGQPGGQRMFVFDPDGHLIQVVQIDKR